MVEAVCLALGRTKLMGPAYLGQCSRFENISYFRGQMGCGGSCARALLACLSAGGICESESVIADVLPGPGIDLQPSWIVCPPRRAARTRS